MSTPTPTPVLARVASLGVVLAGCPDCRLPVGLAGAPGLAAALAAHHRGCPKRQHPRPLRPEDEVCPGCGCEAALYLRASGWRCGDCLAEALIDDPGHGGHGGHNTARTANPSRPAEQASAAARTAPHHRARRHHAQGHQRRRPGGSRMNGCGGRVALIKVPQGGR